MAVELRNQGLYEVRREHDACGIGAVVNVSGRKDHSIIQYGRQILVNLHHRGAAGADETTGDGAGILFQIPHDFFSTECEKIGILLPSESEYGAGVIFGPRDTELRQECDALLESAISDHGMEVLGWRDVPTCSECLGQIALQAEPSIKQVFVDACGFDRLVYITQFADYDIVPARRRSASLPQAWSETGCTQRLFQNLELSIYVNSQGLERSGGRVDFLFFL